MSTYLPNYLNINKIILILLNKYRGLIFINIKSILCISFFIIIFSLTSVSAIDFNNDAVVESAYIDDSINVENSLLNHMDVSDYNKVNLNIQNSTPQTFTDFQKEILNVNGSVLYLNQDYFNHDNISVCINKDLVIDGQGHTIDCVNHNGFYSVNGTVCLKNLNIINANVEKNGGAIYIGSLAKYTIENCTFSNNRAKNFGGAIYNEGSNPLTINDCTFKSNSAFDGGGIYSCGDVYINNEQVNDGFFHSVFLNNVASNCGGAIYALNNVYVKNTKVMGNIADIHGPGMCCKKANVINCLFESNREKISFGEGSGGAIHATDDVTVDNSTFKDNFAESIGGAIYSEKGNVYINYNQSNTQTFNSFFIKNVANDDQGGAIFTRQYFGKVYVKNTVFSFNHANVDGGAIFAGDIVDADHCKFNSNKAAGSTLRTCYGGAIRTYAKVFINNCSFIENYAENSGGAIYTSELKLFDTHSEFIGNVADKGKGGAIYTDTFAKNVKNATFSSNTAGKSALISDDGGAIYINSKTDVTFSYCVFIDNSCTDEGGVIYLDSINSKLTLIHNVFKNNKAKDEGQTVFNKGTYVLISGNYWGGNNPNSQNDQLIEWKALRSNVHHVDCKPSNRLPE